jgi:hypothetical protein
MKIKKLVRVIAKSDFMDVDNTMVSSKATGFVKRIKKIHTLQIDALRVERKVTYRPRGSWKPKTRIVRELPSGINSKITVTIEPAGEILD